MQLCLEKSFNEIDPLKLTTVGCIGPVNAAVLTPEIWDVNRFDTVIKLNGYVCSYPELSESGNC